MQEKSTGLPTEGRRDTERITVLLTQISQMIWDYGRGWISPQKIVR